MKNVGIIPGNRQKEITDIILKVRNSKDDEPLGSYVTKELISVRRKAHHNVILKHNVLVKEVCVATSHYSFLLLFYLGINA